MTSSLSNSRDVGRCGIHPPLPPPLEAPMSTTFQDTHVLCLVCLQMVRVPYLLQRPNGLRAEENWADVLSLGEQQRIGMV